MILHFSFSCFSCFSFFFIWFRFYFLSPNIRFYVIFFVVIQIFWGSSHFRHSKILFINPCIHGRCMSHFLLITIKFFEKYLQSHIRKFLRILVFPFLCIFMFFLIFCSFSKVKMINTSDRYNLQHLTENFIKQMHLLEKGLENVRIVQSFVEFALWKIVEFSPFICC